MPRRTSGAAERRSMIVNTASSTSAAGQRRGGLHPRHVGQADDAEHQQQHGGGQADGAADVEAAATRTRGARRGAGSGRATSEQAECEQDRGEEDPAPVDRGQQSTGDHAEREAAGRGAAVDEQGPVACLALVEVGRDDRQARRREEPGADAGGEAGEDQHPSLRRQPAEAGEGDEHDERGEEHAPPAEQVGGPSAEQHEAAVAEDVGADDPLQRRRRQVRGRRGSTAGRHPSSTRRGLRGRRCRTGRAARPTPVG